MTPEVGPMTEEMEIILTEVLEDHLPRMSGLKGIRDQGKVEGKLDSTRTEGQKEFLLLQIEKNLLQIEVFQVPKLDHLTVFQNLMVQLQVL